MKKIFLTASISLLFISNLYANKNSVDLQNVVIETPKIEKKYEQKEDYLKQPNLEEKSEKKKEDKISIDGGVDFNKSEKSVDGVKINLGTKF